MNTLFANIYLALQTAGNKLRREEQGATAVEYGIMVAGIAVVVIGGRVPAWRLGRAPVQGIDVQAGCVDCGNQDVTTHAVSIVANALLSGGSDLN